MENFYPFEDYSYDYESFLIPVEASFLNKNTTPKKIKTAFMRAWVDKCKSFIENKPDDVSFCKIFSVVTCPDLSSSQLYIFYKKECYDNFWNDRIRDNGWCRITAYSLNDVRKISSLNEVGYFENVETENGKKYKELLWFFGDVESI